MSKLDFTKGGFFGLVSGAEASEISERRHVLFAAMGEEIFGELVVISGDGGLNDGMVGLVGLNKDASFIKMTAPNSADNLGEKLKSALFGGKIRQSETTIGLNDANGGKMRQI